MMMCFHVTRGLCHGTKIPTAHLNLASNTLFQFNHSFIFNEAILSYTQARCSEDFEIMNLITQVFGWFFNGHGNTTMIRVVNTHTHTHIVMVYAYLVITT